MEGLIKITPDKNKAASIFKMLDKTLEMIKTIDIDKFPSNVTKEYYNIIRELISVIALLDGYKTYGEGAHKSLIDYVEKNKKEVTSYEISLINELRITRNKIEYDGFFVEKIYIERRLEDILILVEKLKKIIKEKNKL